ncbi:prepilin peptidase [Methylobacterium nigriterrae]|uniref:prepilin peptidase n=1 Tax=Methylobacterium nigriterrae TaxID=3127512 RepID=UPI003013F60A
MKPDLHSWPPESRHDPFLGQWVLAATIADTAMIAQCGPGSAAALLLALGLGLVAAQIAWQDLADMTIPDEALVGLGLLGLVSRLYTGVLRGDAPEWILAAASLDGFVCAGALLGLREVYFRRRGRDGIGFGDVKLAVSGGILVGTVDFAWSVLGASLAGLVLVGLARLHLGAARGVLVTEDQIAFGALLAPALWIAWLLAATPLLL